MLAKFLLFRLLLLFLFMDSLPVILQPRTDLTAAKTYALGNFALLKKVNKIKLQPPAILEASGWKVERLPIPTLDI